MYTVKGEIDRLAIPPRKAAMRTDGLWRHTCFEFFARSRADSAYDEFNFSPSGEWAAYRFSGYRQGMMPLDIATPSITCEANVEELRLEAVVERLPRFAIDLEVALTAVLRDRADNVYYWALAHGAGKPDFHHEAGFVASLTRTS